MSTPEPAVPRVVFATGTNPEKRFRRPRDRIPATPHIHAADDLMSGLVSGVADMTLVRLKSESSLPESLHRTRLYDEAWGVAFEEEHVFSFAEPVPEELLVDETVLLTSVDADELRQMLPVAATGVGVAVGPRTILKALLKKAVASPNLVVEKGATDPLSRTAIWSVWPKTEDDKFWQEFIGIVRGCREGSTRTQLGYRKANEAPKKLSAREETLAKQIRRQRAGAVAKYTRSGRGGC